MTGYDPLANNDETEKLKIERKKKLRERELSDLKASLELPECRRWFWRLLEETRVFNSSYDAQNPGHTAFNEGVRNVGLFLLNELFLVQPELFNQMRSEAISQRERDLAEEQPSTEG